MDQTLINIALALFIFAGGLVMGALGWFARTLWDQLKEHTKEIAELRVKLAAEYVSNLELATAIIDMKGIVSAMVADIRNDIGYIRNRVDGLPQRRQGDPTP